MFNKFNERIKRLIMESEDKDEMLQLYNSNEFFIRFIEPLAKQIGVMSSKPFENCFQIAGVLKSVRDFFSKFKVDNSFMEKPNDFMIYSPMFTYSEKNHLMNRDEGYESSIEDYRTSPHCWENLDREVTLEGWFRFFDKGNLPIKSCKPDFIVDYFKDNFPKANKDFNETCPIVITFCVNCRGLKNSIWDEMTEWAVDADGINKTSNEEPDDFDYTQLNVKVPSEAELVEKSLKEIEKKNVEVKPEAKTEKAKKQTAKKPAKKKAKK